MHAEILFIAFFVLLHLAPASPSTKKFDRTKTIHDRNIRDVYDEYDNEDEGLAYEFTNLPTKRPLTPVEVDGRKLKPIRVIPAETPCMFQRYTHLYQKAEELQRNAMQLVLEAKTKTNITSDQDYYFYDPEDLCIDIDDDLVVDVFQFDCSEDDICICGKYYGYVDPNIEQPVPILNNATDTEELIISYVYRTYIATSGLDRKLVAEDGKCVSGQRGHCLPQNSTAIEELPCTRSYECILDDSFGTILRNKEMKYMYGICLPKSPTVPSADNMIVYEALLAGSPPNHTPTIRTLILTVTVLENMALVKALLFNN